MNDLEYLMSYGLLGDFGRFRSHQPIACRRGERAVVRSHRGVEVAQVLGPATPRHARYLPNTTLGEFLRLAGPDDVAALDRLRLRGQEVLDRGNRLAHELGLAVELLDVEMLLDGQHAVLHHVRWAAGDIRPLVSTLSREYEMHVLLTDLSRSATAAVEEEHDEHGCGRPDCGSGAGGCGSCGTGGGCGTCGTAKPQEVQAYFAGLREKMEERTSLL
jgi:PSP1 C-terminal conserved region